MALSFSTYYVHSLAHSLSAKLYEVRGRAILRSLLQAQDREAHKAMALLGLTWRVDPGISKIWRQCPAPSTVSLRPAGRPPRTHTCLNPQRAGGPSGDVQGSHLRVRDAPDRYEPTMAAALAETALPRVLPTSRTENSAAWSKTIVWWTKDGAHTRAAFLILLGVRDTSYRRLAGRLLQNHISQKSPWQRVVSEHRENYCLGFLRNYSTWSCPGRASHQDMHEEYGEDNPRLC